MPTTSRYTIHAGNRGKCFPQDDVTICDGFDMSYGDKMNSETRIWRIAGIKNIDIEPLKNTVVERSQRSVVFYPKDVNHVLECSFDGNKFSCKEKRLTT